MPAGWCCGSALAVVLVRGLAAILSTGPAAKSSGWRARRDGVAG